MITEYLTRETILICIRIGIEVEKIYLSLGWVPIAAPTQDYKSNIKDSLIETRISKEILMMPLKCYSPSALILAMTSSILFSTSVSSC